MTLYEQERAAYIAGDTERAELLARIDKLQRALGLAIVELELCGRDEIVLELMGVEYAPDL